MRRTFGLDVLRCVAISIVLWNHSLLYWFQPFGHLKGARMTFVPLLAIPAVEMLFVLSGFLIGTMMVRSFEGQGTFQDKAKAFWLRRWFRTVPTYYLFLVVNIVLVGVGLGEGHVHLSHFVFSQNLAWSEPAAIGPHGYEFFFTEAWSLSLDEWFYFVMPLLIGFFAFVLAKPNKATFLWATATLIAIPIVARFLHAPVADVIGWDRDIRRVTLYHLDATGWGVMAAVVSRWAPGLWNWRPGLKALLGAVLLFVGMRTYLELPLVAGTTGLQLLPSQLTLFPRLANAVGITLIGLGVALALPWIARAQTPSRWLPAVAGTVSNYTYSIYLAHMPVLYVLRSRVAAGASMGKVGLMVGLWLVCVFGVAALVYHTFEKPISDLRERYTKRVDANPFQVVPAAPTVQPASASETKA